MNQVITLEQFFDADQALRQELHKYHADSDRLIGTVTALEDLAERLGKREKISLEDIELIEMSDQFAAAGTDARRGDILPAVKEGTDTAIAIENIFEKITTAISGLTTKATALSWIAEKRILGFSVAAKTREGLLKGLKQNLANAQSMGKDFHVSIKVPPNSGIKDKESFLRYYETEAQALTQMLDIYTDGVKVVDGMLAKTLKSFALLGYGYSEAMADNFNQFKNKVMQPIAKSPLFQKPSATDEGRDVIYSQPLLAGRVVYIQGAMQPDMGIGARRRVVRDQIARLDFNVTSAEEVLSEAYVKVDLEMVQLDKKDAERLISAIAMSTSSLMDYGRQNRHWLKAQRDVFGTVTKLYHAVTNLPKAFAAGDSVKGLSMTLGMTIQMAAAEGALPEGAAKAGMDIINKSGTYGALATAAGISLTALSAMVLDWGRKKIISSCFSSMALQYKITKIIDNFDTHVIDLIIDNQNRGERIVRRCLPK